MELKWTIVDEPRDNWLVSEALRCVGLEGQRAQDPCDTIIKVGP